MDFKDIVIYSDADNTFLKSWGEGVTPSAPENNLEAVKYFMEKGGHFSMATGREHNSVMQFFPYKLNMPIVQSNGTLLYDDINSKILYATYLTKEMKKEIIDLCLSNKKYWLCCGTPDGILQVDFNDERDNSLHDIERKHTSVDFCMNNDVCKLCYVVEKQDMPELIEDVKKFKCFDQINAAQSSAIYYECFNGEANKGKGIEQALKLTHMEDKTLVCIGDYYNDWEMLKVADIKVCPDNSPDDIKAFCDFVVCNNNEGAIADLIYKLEKM